ncbi:hypothetical protein AVEN_272358-1 [Araneus ventricosus]|uniref:Retrovirus-related Pol polyprotein from transposon TNT 1-94-like beta-barrel domain-containing protein n=1 Tax=Araneus ventricosus TaxID=182803 RepID=A0A4Y2GR43_ARAVE|nr:hypothetical protein AVEN_272358-1 [Araneus ventricosus]
MTCEKAWIYNYTDLQNPIKIKNANGNLMDALGRGNILIRTFDGKNWQTGELKNVLCVPDLKCNLFILNSVSEEGYSVKLDRIFSRIMNGQQTKLLGNRKLKLYKLVLETDEKAFLGTYSGRIDDLFTWHKKFAYENINQAKYVFKSQGIEYKDSEEFTCENSVAEESGASNYESNTQNAIPKRVTKIPEKYNVFELYSTYSFIAGEGVLTFKDAMQSTKWTQALKRELNSLKKMYT